MEHVRSFMDRFDYRGKIMIIFQTLGCIFGYRHQAIRKRAFTLTEMLVVLAVIALLLTLLPALAGARNQSKKAVCTAQLGRIGAIWLTYANDYEDVLPISNWPWNSVWGFLHDILDEYDSNAGETFYCPTYTYPKDYGGNNYDWYNPRFDPTIYYVGYNLFTNVVYLGNYTYDPLHPDNLPWRVADGMGGGGYLSWQYAYMYGDLDLRHIIPPVKSTERKHWVSCWHPQLKIIIPDEIPMAFDRATSRGSPFLYRPITDPAYTFDKSSCSHLSFTQELPSIINAVYLDGHVAGRTTSEIKMLRDLGQWNTQIWF